MVYSPLGSYSYRRVAFQNALSLESPFQVSKLFTAIRITVSAVFLILIRIYPPNVSIRLTWRRLDRVLLQSDLWTVSKTAGRQSTAIGRAINSSRQCRHYQWFNRALMSTNIGVSIARSADASPRYVIVVIGNLTLSVAA